MNGISILKRSISLIVALCFLTTNAMAMPALEPGTTLSAQHPANIFPIAVPAGLGSVIETYTAPRSTVHDPRNETLRTPDAEPRTVIYIQDAHDSLEAQENIAEMIRYFVKEYGVKTVYEEGYEGAVPTDKLFGSIKNPALKEKISYYLMDKLRVGGAEYAHINRRSRLDDSRQTTDHSQGDAQSRGPWTMDRGLDFELIGADSISLHIENIRAYEQAAKNRGDVTRDIQHIRKELQKLIDKNFPGEMKKWLSLKARHQNGQLPLSQYLERAMQIRRSQRPSTDDRRHKSSNISKLLSRDEKKIKQMNLATLLAEIKAMEAEIVEGGLPAARDQKTYAYFQSVLLLEKLNSVQLSAEEYALLKDSLESLKTEDIARFIAQESRQSVVFFLSWEELITDAIKFYELAKKRDNAIEKILGDRVEGIGDRKAKEGNPKPYTLNPNISVLVFGGFHKEAIKRILKEKGISYVILSPSIGSPSKRHEDYYRMLMSGGKYAFEAPASVSKGLRTNNRRPATYSEKSFSSIAEGRQSGESIARESTRAQSAFTMDYGLTLDLLVKTAGLFRGEPRQDFILKMDRQDSLRSERRPSPVEASTSLDSLEARSEVRNPVGVARGHQYAKLSASMSSQLYKEVLENFNSGGIEYTQRFVRGVIDSRPLIPLDFEDVEKRWKSIVGEESIDRMAHSGFFKDENGVYWILKHKEAYELYELSRDKRWKNIAKRELLAYLLMRGRANFTEIRRVSPDEGKALKIPWKSVADYYLTRVVTPGNMKGALPHQERMRAASALFVGHIFLRKWDQHLKNAAFLDKDVRVSIDNDTINNQETYTKTPGGLRVFAIDFLINSLFKMTRAFAGFGDKDLLRDDLQSINGVRTLLLDHPEAEFDEPLKMVLDDLGLGRGYVHAEGLDEQFIAQTISAIKAIKDVREIAQEAGYTGEELDKVVTYIEANQKTLGADVGYIWEMLTGNPLRSEVRNDQQLAEALVREGQVEIASENGEIFEFRYNPAIYIGGQRREGFYQLQAWHRGRQIGHFDVNDFASGYSFEAQQPVLGTRKPRSLSHKKAIEVDETYQNIGIGPTLYTLALHISQIRGHKEFWGYNRHGKTRVIRLENKTLPAIRIKSFNAENKSRSETRTEVDRDLSPAEEAQLEPEFPTAEAFFGQYQTWRTAHPEHKLITLVRHGRSTSNEFEYGQSYSLFSPLTLQGWLQAMALTNFFRKKNIVFDDYLSSDLERAYQTVHLLARGAGKKQQILKRLREVKTDWFGGFPKGRSSNLREKIFGVFRQDPEQFEIDGFSGRKLEKYLGILFFQDIPKRSGKNFLIGLHGITLLVALTNILRIPSRKFDAVYEKVGSPGNVAVTVLSYDPASEKWRLLVRSDNSFLSPQFREWAQNPIIKFTERVFFWVRIWGRVLRGFLGDYGPGGLFDYHPQPRIWRGPSKTDYDAAIGQAEAFLRLHSADKEGDRTKLVDKQAATGPQDPSSPTEDRRSEMRNQKEEPAQTKHNRFVKRYEKIKKIVRLVVRDENGGQKVGAIAPIVTFFLLFDMFITTLLIKPALIGAAVFTGNSILILAAAGLTFVIGGVIRMMFFPVLKVIWPDIFHLTREGFLFAFLPGGPGNFSPVKWAFADVRLQGLVSIKEIYDIAQLLEESVSEYSGGGEDKKPILLEHSAEIAKAIWDSQRNLKPDYNYRRFKIRGVKGYDNEKVKTLITREDLSEQFPLLIRWKEKTLALLGITSPGYRDGTRPILLIGERRQFERIREYLKKAWETPEERTSYLSRVFQLNVNRLADSLAEDKIISPDFIRPMFPDLEKAGPTSEAPYADNFVPRKRAEIRKEPEAALQGLGELENIPAKVEALWERALEAVRHKDGAEFTATDHSNFRYALAQEVAKALGAWEEKISRIWLFGSVASEDEESVGPQSDIDLILEVVSDTGKQKAGALAKTIDRVLAQKMNSYFRYNEHPMPELLDIAEKIFLKEEIVAGKGFSSVVRSTQTPPTLLFERGASELLTAPSSRSEGRIRSDRSEDQAERRGKLAEGSEGKEDRKKQDEVASEIPREKVAARPVSVPSAVRPEMKQIVRTAIENLKGKFTVVTDIADVANFTDKQLEEFEIMAHLQPNVRFVFYGQGAGILRSAQNDSALKRIEQLQRELGADRIVITKSGIGDLALNKGEKLIRITKGNGEGVTRKANKKIFQFRYRAEETGLVPMALLYADQHEKPSQKGMMDLSMVRAELRVAIQEFQNSLVFARAA